MHLLAKGGPGPACPGSLSPGAPCHHQPGGSLTLETLSQVLAAHRYPGRSAGSRGAAHLLQALDAGLQAGRAGPQLTVLLVQLLQPGAQRLGWDPRGCPRPPHVPTRARAPHTPGRRPHLRCGEASHLQKSCRHRGGPWTPSPWRLLKTSARSRGICHTHAGNMGDQATASTQPPPDAPSRRVPTPQHHHGSSVLSGLQHLWASPLFVTLTF